VIIVCYHLGNEIPEHAQYFTSSVRKYMPSAHIVQATDNTTPSIPGVDEVLDTVLPFELNKDTISLAGYLCLSEVPYREVLFADTDMMFNGNIEELMNLDAEIVVATRPSYNGMRPWYCRKYPYNSMMVVKNQQFWKDCYTKLKAMELKWENNMIAVRDVINSGKYTVKIVDGNVYNYLPRRVSNYSKDIKVFHFKGFSKKLMESFYNLYWGDL